MSDQDLAPPQQTFPGSAPVKDLSIEHRDYRTNKTLWAKLDMLYKGDEQFREQRANFLTRRPKELQDVYEARLQQVAYQNILSTGLGFYRAAMFKNDMNVMAHKMNPNGTLTADPVDAAVDSYYIAFRNNCDRQGTSLTDFMRELFLAAALNKVAYVLMDVSKGSASQSLRSQKETGVLDGHGKVLPYLVPYHPLQVINWGNDDQGNMTWCVISYVDYRSSFLAPTEVYDVWCYYDQTSFSKYEYKRKPEEVEDVSSIPEDAMATLVDSGLHALSAYKQNPVTRFQLTDTLWLGNRVMDPVIDHFNSDQAYSWALRQGCLAMPVIMCDADIKPVLSEVGFIKLPKDSKYEWSEPKGYSFAKMSDRVNELREEVYRLMYLTAQGRQSSATAAAASKISKEYDMMPATEVMNEFGDFIKDCVRSLLASVATCRGDKGVGFDIRGMKFGRTASIEDIQKTQATISLLVPSNTFTREMYRQIARNYLPDANPEIMQTINDEIDAMPDMTAIQAQARQQVTKEYQQDMLTAGGRFTSRITDSKAEN